jgi:hypothetical protein
MKPEYSHRTDEVYGIGREIPLNYVTRKTVDEKLVESLPRGKHLVIFGSSKQGKTCLRKHCLLSDDYITVHCSNRWTVSDINTAILKQSGYELTQSTTRTTSGQAKISAKIGFRLFGSGGETAAEGQAAHASATQKAPLELDPHDVNDIIRALGEIQFKKFIVLEDFHYLPTETQKDFAVALKAYHENSKLCFMIVGVWLEENRLSVYNGDLTGRVLSIDADKWEDPELREVITAGEALLNVRFSESFKSMLVESCFGSVHIVQEACYRACVDNRIYQTCEELREVGNGIDVQEVINKVVQDQSGRFNSFLSQFAIGFEETALQMYRWLLYPVITSEPHKLEKGLGLQEIRRQIAGKHPKGSDLNAGNVVSALNYAAALQVKKGVKPIVLDYDESNSLLRVVDRTFIIWLQMQNRNALLELVDLPTD